MEETHTPERALLESWLKETHVEHYLCGHCEGLHISAMQNLEGVANSRIYLENYGLIFSTELEIRPMALLPAAADLGRLNMDYPTLKIFLDVVDDATPHLVVAANLLISAGVTPGQFNEFVASTMEGTQHLADECLRLDYLFAEIGPASGGGSRSVH